MCTRTNSFFFYWYLCDVFIYFDVGLKQCTFCTCISLFCLVVLILSWLCKQCPLWNVPSCLKVSCDTVYLMWYCKDKNMPHLLKMFDFKNLQGKILQYMTKHFAVYVLYIVFLCFIMLILPYLCMAVSSNFVLLLLFWHANFKYNWSLNLIHQCTIFYVML